MHLDTVFTLLDRDKATAYPKVVDNIRAISLRPGQADGRLPRHRRAGLPRRRRRRARRQEAARRRDRRRRVPAGARAVGRRQQRRRPRARRRRRLRAQHLHDRQDARGRRRGGRDRGLRARQGPRRRALHDVPAAAGPGVRSRRDVRPALVRWVLAVVVALAIVALLAYAPRRPGDDGRVPDPEDVVVDAVRVASSADGRRPCDGDRADRGTRAPSLARRARSRWSC